MPLDKENVEQMDKKYVIITDPYDPDYDEKTYEGKDGNTHYLHKIRAIIDFGDIKNGTVGGFVESYNNLAFNVEDKSWLEDGSVIGGGATVKGGAIVCKQSIISNHAIINAKAVIKHSEISRAIITGEYTFDNVCINIPIKFMAGSGMIGNGVMCEADDTVTTLNKYQEWLQDPEGHRDITMSSMMYSK